MSDIAPDDPVVQRNCEVVRRILTEIWTEGNIDLADELVAEDAVDNDRQPGEENGLESFKFHVVELRKMASDLHLAIDQIWGAGDKVVARWRWQGTHDGRFFDVPPTYRPFDMTTVAMYRLDDGKVVEIWKATDMLQMVEQIGLLPPRGTGPVGFLAHFVKGIFTTAYRQMRGAPKTSR